MPTSSQTSLFDEARLAAQGTLRVLVGKRDAGLYFAEDMRGLVGSFIALVVAIGINLLATAVAAAGMGLPVSSSTTLFTTVLLYGAQIAATYAVFRVLNAYDKFVPYLVADNWTTFFLTLFVSALGLVGLGGSVSLVVAGIATLIAKINIARIVAELRAAHVALLIVGQLVGAAIGLLVIGAILGPAPTPQ